MSLIERNYVKGKWQCYFVIVKYPQLIRSEQIKNNGDIITQLGLQVRLCGQPYNTMECGCHEQKWNPNLDKQDNYKRPKVEVMWKQFDYVQMQRHNDDRIRFYSLWIVVL